LKTTTIRGVIFCLYCGMGLIGIPPAFALENIDNIDNVDNADRIDNQDIINNPELLYQMPLNSDSKLLQKITINRNFKDINQLVEKLNSIQGVKAKVTRYALATPPEVGVSLNNATLNDLLNQVSPKLGYSWCLDNDTIIFTAITANKNDRSKQLTKVMNDGVAASIITSDLITPLPAASNLPKEIVMTPVAAWVLGYQDGTLRNVISKWCNQAKWQLIWNVKADFPISASWTINGSFEFAINELLKASQQTDVPLYARMHDSNHVVEIYSNYTK
jgi:hypothetical protein